VISVVTPNWDGKRFLKVFFDSALSQHVEGETLEFILVDNGSTDGSRDYVRDCYPDVRVVAFDANRGFSIAVNEGIRASQGEWIALLNNDLRMAPGALEAMWKTLQKHPEAGFCAAKMLFFDRPNLINAAGDGLGLDGEPFNVGFLEPDEGQFDEERRVLGACAGAAMYRRSMLEDVGLLDEDFFLNFEDVDLSLRANLMGYSGIYTPDAIVYHHHSATLEPWSYRHVFFTSKNAWNIAVKNFPLSVFLRCFPRMLLREMRRAAIFCAVGQSEAYREAKLAYLRDLRKMIGKRRTIQDSRKLSSREFLSLLSLNQNPAGYSAASSGDREP
jgi:GT2 family glycosyltransferase